MVWRIEDPQGNEAAKVAPFIVPYTRGKVLDLGCGPHKAFPHFTGVDNLKDVELFGVEMKPDFVVDTCEDLPFKDATYDAVFSSHLLEHIVEYKAALAEWWRVIKPGGHLCLYLPHADLYPRIGEPGGNPDHKHDFRNEDIERAMLEVGTSGWDLVIDEMRNLGREYSFFQIYRKRDDGKFFYPAWEPKPAKTVCIVRYGGFGDMLQTAAVLPELKRQGFHITLMTTPKGQDILRHDPHVDAWLIQDKDQFPNHLLAEYWRAWATRFHRFVNLSESIEGTLLGIPGRSNHAWPAPIRRARMGTVNYGEWTAELARVPFKPEGRFYPSEEEAWDARALVRAHVGDDFSVMWALAGSSVHKFYPWMDQVIARVLSELPEARIVLVGDEACKLLEQGWENEPRVVRLSGKLEIRQTLALARAMHCVVGPETGVLNSVAYDSGIAKVVMLSHSSRENLTKHWVNTHAALPKNVACYPCHRLHYNREFCAEHVDSGASMCQAAIDPDEIVAVIGHAHADWIINGERDERRRVA